VGETTLKRGSGPGGRQRHSCCKRLCVPPPPGHQLTCVRVPSTPPPPPSAHLWVKVCSVSLIHQLHAATDLGSPTLFIFTNLNHLHKARGGVGGGTWARCECRLGVCKRGEGEAAEQAVVGHRALLTFTNLTICAGQWDAGAQCECAQLCCVQGGGGGGGV
jgi:hypothetical protein